jgi:hypothetical protein
MHRALGNAMQKKWNISLASWILEDGNCPTFYSGEEAEFACSFGGKNLAYSASSLKTADLLNENRYRVNAEVVYIDSDIWILDFGIFAYSSCVHPRVLNSAQDPTGELQETFKFQQTLKIGQMISADVSLAIDHYMYFEHYCENQLIPPMIYKWHLDAIEGDSRKIVQFDTGFNGLNKPEPEWCAVGSTEESAWKFLLHCDRSDDPPHRCTAPEKPY